VGETIFVNRATSMFCSNISPDVLDRMVRTALRRPEGRGPVGRLLGNAPHSTAQASERTATRQRETLVLWIADELRRWSRSPAVQSARRGARALRPSPRPSESFPAR
jgi:hypothetical protein